MRQSCKQAALTRVSAAADGRRRILVCNAGVAADCVTCESGETRRAVGGVGHVEECIYIYSPLIINRTSLLSHRYQNELPKKIKSRGKDPHLTHEELVQTIKWKLAVSVQFGCGYFAGIKR